MYYIIAKSGMVKSEVFWLETQESPARGYWVANIKKATKFTKQKRAERYISKYINTDYKFEMPSVRKIITNP